MNRQMPLAYIYSRVSTKRQIDGLGLKRQAEDRNKWLAAHAELNLTVVQDHTDLGMSGRGKNRTEGKLGLIIDAIQTGKMPVGSYLIVDNLDRISREELIDAYYLILSIVRAGIVIVTTSDGMVYDRGDRERVMFSLLISLVIVARSSNESDAKSDRGLKNWAMKRQAAGSQTLERPYTRMTPAWIDYDGNQKKFALNVHANTVRRIFELAAQGFGTALIVQHLIKGGHLPMAAGRRKDALSWSRRYVTLILENRAVLGEFALGTKNQAGQDKRHLTGQVIEGYYPSIPGIHDLWNKAAAIRETRKALADKSRNRRGDFTNLFAGLCRCTTCNSAMVINHRQAPSKVSYLRCPARYLSKTCTGGNQYQYQRLEKAILDQLDGLLFRPSDFETAQPDGTVAELAQAKIKVDDIGRRISNLLDEAEEEGYSLHRERIAVRRAELEAAERLVRDLEGKAALDRHTLNTAEYVAQIKAKRADAESDNVEVRAKARAVIRLHLRRLIKVMSFNRDRSVSIDFELPENKTRYRMDISHDAEPVIRWTTHETIRFEWSNPKGGQHIVAGLQALDQLFGEQKAITSGPIQPPTDD